MFKFINLKQATALTFIVILTIGSIALPTRANNGNGNGNNDRSCGSNNGHGNNAPIPLTLSTGTSLTVTRFDPSNPGNGGYIDRRINAANSNLTSAEFLEAKNKLQQLVRDVELHGRSSDGSDCGNDTASPDSITLTGTIRDFQASHPDFEFSLLDKSNLVRATLSNGVTTAEGKNIVTTSLANEKPVYNPSTGAQTVESAATFNQWFRDVNGINLSKPHTITLAKNADGMYEYSDRTDPSMDGGFFPINGQLFGNIIDDPTISPIDNIESKLGNKKDRNYHFTYELNTQFTYTGEDREFTFEGDDDVWVYINGQRVIDLSGVHGAETETFILNAASAAALGLTEGETYDLNFFFAERNFSGSNFKITTDIPLNSPILPPNNPDASPEAEDDKKNTDEDTAKWINVLKNDSDDQTDREDLIITKIDNTLVSVGDVITLESGAKVKLVKRNNTSKYSQLGKYALKYDPTSSYSLNTLNKDDEETETFSYTVSDAEGNTDQAYVEVKVKGITDTYAD